MSRRRKKLEVSTFPFLAVLLCAMGSLILVLLAMDRKAKLATKAKAELAVRQAAEEVELLAAARRAAWERADAERRAEWERQRDALHERVAADKRNLEGQMELLRARLAESARRLREEEAAIAALEGKTSQEKDQLAEVAKALAAKQASAEQARTASAAERRNLERMTADLLLLENTLADLKAARAREKQTYSVVPYKGRRGEGRRPLYIECASTGVIFHPDKLSISPDKPDELRTEVLRRVEQQRAIVQAGGAAVEPVPYLMLLVRPDGIQPYYQFQAALRGMEVRFGYEFIDADWLLDFPADDAPGTPSPWKLTATGSGGSSERVRTAVEGVRARGVPVVTHEGVNAGIVDNAAGQPGSMGLPASSQSRDAGPFAPGVRAFANAATTSENIRHGQHNLRGLLGYGSGGGSENGVGEGVPFDSTGGGSNSGPKGAGGFTGSPGVEAHASATGGSDRPVVGTFPGSGPGLGTGLARSPGNGVTETGIAGGGVGQPGASNENVRSGQPVASTVGGENHGALSGSSSLEPPPAIAGSGVGTGQPGTPGASAKPDNLFLAVGGGEGGSAGAPSGANASNGVPSSNGASGAAGKPLDESLPRSPFRETGAAAPGAGGGQASTDVTTPRPFAPGQTDNPAAPPTARKNTPETTTGGNRAATASTATPSTGRAGDPGQEGDAPDPLARYSPPALVRKEPGPRKPIALRPARLNGDRDYLIYVECRADSVVLFPSQRVFPLSVLNRGGSTNPLAQAIQQMIDRRQSSVAAGAQPYRPQVCFLVRPESIRAFHTAYPALDGLGIPKARLNLQPEDDVLTIVTSH